MVISSSWQKDIIDLLGTVEPKATKLFFLIDSKVKIAPDWINVDKKFYIIDVFENNKSIDSLIKLYDECEGSGLDRDSIIVVVGGGVVGDLGGFLASTLFRGIRWINIPTTLLSQVDSSVGGKTGINSFFSKNAIGTFWFPVYTIIDSSFLKTLSKRDFNSGVAEIIKYGLIDDEKILTELEEFEPNLSLLIEKSVLVKKQFIEKDPFDAGERGILNLGHTLGHALERYFDYKELTHGEAIATGILFSLYFSHKKFGFCFKDLVRIYKLFLRFNLIKHIKLPTPERIVVLVERDKKRRGLFIKEIFLRSIGKPILMEISTEEWQLAYSTFFTAFSRLCGNLTISPTDTLPIENQP